MKNTHLVFLLLVGCTPSAEFPPKETPLPTPTASPTPNPRPVLWGPSWVPSKAIVTFYLCEPYKPNTFLMVDGQYSLGAFSDNRMSGCMQLTYPSFNTSGIRTLTANGHEWKIKVGP